MLDANRKLATLLLLALSATAAAQYTSKTVRKHRVAVEEDAASQLVTRAEAAFDKRDFAAAEQLLKDATTKNPKDHRAWYDLGLVYTALDKRQDAIAAYRQSVTAKPDVFEANLNLGLLLASAGDPDAEKFLRAATQLKPGANAADAKARAWLGLGQVLQATRQADAILAYRQAAALDPKDADVHMVLAGLLEAKGEFAAAEAEYKSALRLNPHLTDALAGLINVYGQTKRYAEAETALREYLKADPTNLQARINLARVLAVAGRPEEGAAEMEQALKTSNPDETLLRELASMYGAAGKSAEAVRIYRRAVLQFPASASLHHALGLALRDARDYIGAQQEFIAALKIQADMVEAYGDLAAVAFENKNYALVIKVLDARVKYLPEDAGTYLLRATSYDHLAATQQAIQYYREFLKVANGRFPDEEWKARHRLIALEPKR